MKLLLDQGLPRSTVQALAALGIPAEHVGDLGMAAASDVAILAAAEQRNAVVVTLDADFHAILATTGAAQPSCIRFRIEGLNAGELAALLQQVTQVASADLAAGAVATVMPPNLVRIRTLPIK
jgi:predicted nuclease of predicted toxin-antitoxin system